MPEFVQEPTNPLFPEEEVSEVKLRKQIFDNCPDIEVVLKENGSVVNASSVLVDEDGKITKVLQVDSVESIPAEDVDICVNFLPVPGVGYLKPKTKVRWRGHEYWLLFGWHTNISNQRIFSWFLRDVLQTTDATGKVVSVNADHDDKTLYYEMIDEIDLVTV